MEWVESNYYHLPLEQQTAALITANAFWLDYADTIRPPESRSSRPISPSRRTTSPKCSLRCRWSICRSNRPSTRRNSRARK